MRELEYGDTQRFTWIKLRLLAVSSILGLIFFASMNQQVPTIQSNANASDFTLHGRSLNRHQPVNSCVKAEQQRDCVAFAQERHNLDREGFLEAKLVCAHLHRTFSYPA